jgi:Inosine-uridine preferring nucleoside hydrolase
MRHRSALFFKMSTVCLFILLLSVVRTVAADRCILIDTDAGLDDYRAIAALASGKDVVRAIIVTEGISRRAEGAVAMQDFLLRSELTIPVLLGATPDLQREPNNYREYEARKKLLSWRKVAESLNGVLNSVGISSPAESDVATAIRPYISDCSKITLLVIGPWTSFMRYATAILPRIDRIVAQGRPHPDEIGGEPDGFNCVYDLPSCFAAFDLLVGRQQRVGQRLGATWVDIPNNAEACGLAEPGVDGSGKRVFAFAPDVAWLESLRDAGGRAKVIAEILQNQMESWKKTSLWDDLTALYILRPDLFGVRGGHLEPCIPSQSVRDLLKEFMSKG